VANERIVSPGVFTNENDLSFLQQGIGQIGAALIGPTLKGPAFVPTVVQGYGDYLTKFGGTFEQSYLPYTAKNYLNNAGSATIVRVMGTGGYSLIHPIALVATGSWGKKLISMLHPTFVVTSGDSTSLFADSTITANASGSFVITVAGDFETDLSFFTNAQNEDGVPFSSSINPEDTSYIGNLYGYNPYGTHAVYNYVNFRHQASASLAADPLTTVLIESGSAGGPWDFLQDYLEASTPWVTSQKVGARKEDLFRFHTLSHGVHSNYEVKVGIANIRPAGSIAGSEYGDFDVVVRYVDQSRLPQTPFNYEDEDIRPSIVETFKCNLDPNSPKFISRVIGDRFITITSEGKVVVNGDYSNKSKYIRVEVTEAVTNSATPPSLVPFGFRAPKSPIPTQFTQPPAASYVTDQTVAGAYNRRVYWGFDYDFANTDNFNYLRALPIADVQTTGSNIDFYLGDYQQNPAASFPSSATAYSSSIDLTSNTALDSRKFMLPMQGGFDGHKPNLQKKTGTYIEAGNTQGFDISNSSADGYVAYKKAVDAISNADEFDINLIAMPGVLHSLHSAATTYAIDMCENRGDTFYVMDSTGINDNIASATSTSEGLDTNYAATYYPWVKILDFDRNKPIWVPPSVVLPGVIAFNDRVSAEWFAPAGLNRGGLTEVVEVKTRLTQAERDTLYEARINPIAVFPSTGVCVWGQKTLQGRPSALDRINVRRLLIAAKKFIASSTRYLVFEQNTSQTRTRFLNIVNPYLESIQQRQGLYAFRVIMDESNNTPDIIDRNILYGQLYLQPAKTAEFIILDFNIQSTGAAFPGA
jgi:Phage tail sheath protein subtilisin-like domain/Phage tail sheath C-terminal domain